MIRNPNDLQGSCDVSSLACQSGTNCGVPLDSPGLIFGPTGLSDIWNLTELPSAPDAPTVVGGGTTSAWAFAYNPTTPNQSLAYADNLSVGNVCLVGAFGLNNRGAAVWKVVGLQVVGGNVPGTVSYSPTDGIILDGVKFRFSLVADNEIDPAMVGAAADATLPGQAALWEIVRQYACKYGAVIKPSSATRYIVARELDMVNVTNFDGQAVEFLEQEGGFNGSLIVFDNRDILEMPALPGMRELKISEPRQSVVRAKGLNVGPKSDIGQYDFQGVRSQATGVVLKSDNGGNSVRRFHVNRLKTGLVLRGGTEKNIIDVHATYCDVAIRGDTLNGGSPDTLRINLSGTNNKQAFLPDDGDTSFQLYLNTEGRIDDGSTVPCYWDKGLTQRPAAYIECKTGKHFKIGGRHRAHNGRLMITDDRFYEDGSDTVEFDNLGVVHCYGTVYSNYRIQHLTGHIELHDVLNGRPNFAATDETGGSIPCPAIHLRQVGDATGFSVNAQKVSAREVVRWGDAGSGLYSRNAHMGRYSGVAESKFVASGGIFNPAFNRFSNAMTYLHIEKAERCFAVFEGYGNIKAEAGCVDCRLDVPHGSSWVMGGYSATDENGQPLPAGRLSLDLGGSIGRDDLIWRPWVFDGLSALIPEFGGKSVRRSGVWSLATSPTVSLSDLGSISHWINIHTKQTGTQVFYEGRPLFASGSSPTASWVDSAGTAVVTSIGYNARTLALASRLGAVWDSLPDKIKLAYDGLLYDLSVAGVLERLIALNVYGLAPDMALGTKSLVAAASGTYYDQIQYGTVTHVPYAYVSGDGLTGYLDTRYNPQVLSEGMTTDNMHIGIYSLGPGKDAGMDAGSLLNDRLGIGGTDYGMVYYTSSSTYVNAYQKSAGSAPHHIVASRNPALNAGRAYRQGLLLGSDGVAKAGTLPSNIVVCRQGDNFSSEKIGAFHVGLDLTDVQVFALYRALNKALMRSGAIK